MQKRKFLKTITISILALGIFLMPISPSLGVKDSFKIQKNQASADKAMVGLNFIVNVDPNVNPTTDGADVVFNVKMIAKDTTTTIDGYRYLYVVIYKTNGGKPSNDVEEDDYEHFDIHKDAEHGNANEPGDSKNYTTFSANFTDFSSLKKGDKYYFLVFASDAGWDPSYHTYGENIAFLTDTNTSLPYSEGYFTVGGKSSVQNTQTDINNGDYLGCSLFGGWDGIKGCIASLFYLVWEVSAWVAKLAGYFLDFFIFYSTDGLSYKNGFITQGWGAVRDIANIFFIIALLYVAIKTILGLDGHGGKKIIVYIVLMALLINFSLFFTQVIIDSSNILAKVFYNNTSSVKSNGGAAPVTGASGEKTISVGLVDKFNPQKIITQEKYNSMGVGKFIFIIILSTLITLYTAYIFFSVALLFVARVVSLWIAMVFAPIAFASYTLPFEIPGIGHKEWWADLLKNCFLAPVFIFLLYLIIMFAGFLSEIVKYEPGSDDMQSIMSVIIPFILLVGLLAKAKDMAVKYSGEMGKVVSNAGALAGVALGGVALGTAALGRKTFGSVAKYVQNDSTRKGALGYKDTKDQWAKMKAGKGKYNPFSYIKLAGKTVAGTGKFMAAGTAQGIHKIGLGKEMQKADIAFGKKETSQKSLDSMAKTEFSGKFGYGEDVKFKELKEDQQIEVRKAIDRDQIAKDYYKVGDFKSIKDDADRRQVSQNVDTAYRNYQATSAIDPKQAEIDLKHQLELAGIRNKDTSGDMIKHSKADVAMGEFVQALRKGSYDVRNLSQLNSSTKGFAKTAVGTLATAGSLMRFGLKKGGLNIEHGTGQKDFLKDLKNTFTEALKGVKIDVKVDSHGSGGGHGGAHASVSAGHKPAGGGGHGGGHH